MALCVRVSQFDCPGTLGHGVRRQGRGVRRQGHGVRRQSAVSVRPCVAYAATRASRLRMGERTAAGGRVAIAVTRGSGRTCAVPS